MKDNLIISIDSKYQIFLIFNEIRRLIDDDDTFVRLKIFNNIGKIFDNEYKKFYIIIHDGLKSIELRCLKESDSFYLSKKYIAIQAIEIVRDIKLNKIINKLNVI